MDVNDDDADDEWWCYIGP